MYSCTRFYQYIKILEFPFAMICEQTAGLILNSSLPEVWHLLPSARVWLECDMQCDIYYLGGCNMQCTIWGEVDTCRHLLPLARVWVWHMQCDIYTVWLSTSVFLSVLHVVPWETQKRSGKWRFIKSRIRPQLGQSDAQRNKLNEWINDIFVWHDRKAVNHGVTTPINEEEVKR